MGLVGTNLIYKDKNDFSSILTPLYTLFVEMCCQMFKYKNLPAEIPEHIVELNLITKGQCVFAEVGGHYICLPCVLNGEINIYGEPIRVDTVAYNGGLLATFNVGYTNANGELIKPNAVRIKNNLYDIPTLSIMQPFFNRLDYLWKSMGINQALTRAKLFIEANKSQKKSIRAEMRKLFGDENPYALIENKEFRDNLKNGLISNNIEYMADKYWFDFDKLFTYLCTFLGINTNFSSQKKERVVIAEVEVNNEMIGYFKDAMLQYRKKAVEEINKMFGLNIEVEANEVNFSYYDLLKEERGNGEGQENIEEDS